MRGRDRFASPGGQCRPRGQLRRSSPIPRRDTGDQKRRRQNVQARARRAQPLPAARLSSLLRRREPSVVDERGRNGRSTRRSRRRTGRRTALPHLARAARACAASGTTTSPTTNPRTIPPASATTCARCTDRVNARPRSSRYDRSGSHQSRCRRPVIRSSRHGSPPTTWTTRPSGSASNLPSARTRSRSHAI